jgi:hypothetical protein
MKAPRRRSYRDVLNERGVPNEQVVRRDTMPHRPPDKRHRGPKPSKPAETNIN